MGILYFGDKKEMTSLFNDSALSVPIRFERESAQYHINGKIRSGAFSTHIAGEWMEHRGKL